MTIGPKYHGTQSVVAPQRERAVLACGDLLKGRKRQISAACIMKGMTDRLLSWLAAIVCGLSPVSVLSAEPGALKLYLNADFTHSREAVSAISMGIEAALDEVDYRIKGVPVQLLSLDHRGNASRQLRNSRQILADQRYLAMFSGVHSTTLIPNRAFINEQALLTLVPWAAGGAVSRYPGETNWIFRLSIDDARAGPFLVRYAMREKQCRSPHLMLERTPWGESNHKSMTAAFRQMGERIPTVTWFNFSVSEATARGLLREVLQEQVDCLLLVANDREARTIIDALESLPGNEALRVISHWGLAAGDFWRGIPGEDSADTRLRMIQSCFSFNSPRGVAERKDGVFRRIQKLHPEIKQSTDLRAQVGFAHAYDLTRLLLAALEKVDLDQPMSEVRADLRNTLEQLDEPVDGLVKQYQRPFSRFDPRHNPNGHEALHEEDFCMGHFRADGSIFLEVQ